MTFWPNITVRTRACDTQDQTTSQRDFASGATSSDPHDRIEMEDCTANHLGETHERTVVATFVTHKEYHTPRVDE